MIPLPDSIADLPRRTPEWLALLERWAEINSGSGNTAGLDRMRHALVETFASLPGVRVEQVALAGRETKAVRVTQRPDAARRVLLNGHYDTVYEASDAFQTCTRLDHERLGGPGVADMKGGIVVMFAALQALEACPGAERLGWEVLLTPDEETGSHGSAPLFVEAAQRHRFALVFEPARITGDLVHSRKGTGSFTVTCRGRAAHAAQVPNPGRNAILALASFLVAASRIPEEIPGVLLNVGNIRGGGPATNVVPDFAESEIDVRVTRVAERAPLLARLEALAAEVNARDGFRLELAGGFNRLPKECGPVEESAFAAWRACAADVGARPFGWVHSGGGSDGNLMSAAGLPNLDGVGPRGDHLHSDREYLVITSLAERAQIAALFLLRYARGEIGLPETSTGG
jgi:glutamate carboxypeptidase